MQIENSACAGFAIAPSDTVNQPFLGLYVGVAGNITILGTNGATLLLSNVPVGFYPIAGQRVNATGTAATNMV